MLRSWPDLDHGREHSGRARLHRRRRRAELEIRCARDLVYVINAGEAGQLSAPGLGVEAAWVTALAFRQRCVEEHLEDRQPGGLMHLAGQRPVGAYGVIAIERHALLVAEKNRDRQETRQPVTV